MSRNFFKKGPPVSPNMPPPAPMKLPHKGQPMPIDVNLLVLGNTMQPGFVPNPARSRMQDLSNFRHLKPPTSNLDRDFLRDKHVIQSLARPTHVDDSFYDKFERLERDYTEWEPVSKERPGRIRSAGKQRSAQNISGISRDSKRPKSSSVTSKNRDKASDSFFDVAMSFDTETKSNTKSNSESKTDIKSLRRHSANRATNRKERPKSASSAVGRRPRSAKKSRERSSSRKNNIIRRSRSLGSASFCSSRSGKSDKRLDKKQSRDRKSRSRTRQITTLPYKNEVSMVAPIQPRKPSAVRSICSADGRKRQTLTNIRKARLGLRSAPVRRDRVIEVTSKRAPLHPSSAKLDRKQIADKRPRDPITAVKNANEIIDTLAEMKKIDRIIFHEPRRYTSSVPKLKMVVAPTPTPLATLVRHSSTKILMSNAPRNGQL